MNGVDNILETYTPSEVLRKYDSGGQIGVDKFGCPGKSIKISVEIYSDAIKKIHNF